jgi:hypothetical protein
MATRKELKTYLNQVSKDIFKVPFDILDWKKKQTLHLNLIVRKNAGDFDDEIHEKLEAILNEPKIK